MIGEPTLSGLLDEEWSLERPSHDHKLGILSPAPHSLEKGEELKMGLMTDYANMRMGFGEPLGW